MLNLHKQREKHRCGYTVVIRDANIRGASLPLWSIYLVSVKAMLQAFNGHGQLYSVRSPWSRIALYSLTNNIRSAYTAN